MRVLLIDDHNLFRRGLRLMLNDLAADLDITEASNCAEALAFEGDPFDLVLLDINMPGRNGLDGLASIRQAFVSAFVVVLSGEESSKTVRTAIDQGAAGYIPKTSTPEIMIKALQLVLEGGIYLPPQVLSAQSSDSAAFVTSGHTERSAPTQARLLAGMTSRQTEVLKLALKGSPNKIIARQLDISEGTVKSHLSTAFRMLNVRNRTEALYCVAQLGEPI